MEEEARERIKTEKKNKTGELDLRNLRLTELPMEFKKVRENLRFLDCSENKLTSLPELPNVESLICYSNKLTSLPNLPNVVELICYDNQLKTLPDLPKVESLTCFSNELVNLPKLSNVKELICNDNQLKTLPDLPAVENLNCSENQLTKLPQLPNVKFLQCSNNQLKTLPRLPEIIELESYENPFEEGFQKILDHFNDTGDVEQLQKELDNEIDRRETILKSGKNLGTLYRSVKKPNGTLKEQYLFDEKLPRNVQNVIGSYFTGKKGTLKQQEEKLKKNLGIKPRKGGARKTRKYRR